MRGKKKKALRRAFEEMAGHPAADALWEPILDPRSGLVMGWRLTPSEFRHIKKAYKKRLFLLDSKR